MKISQELTGDDFDRKVHLCEFVNKNTTADCGVMKILGCL